MRHIIGGNQRLRAFWAHATEQAGQIQHVLEFKFPGENDLRLGNVRWLAEEEKGLTILGDILPPKNIYVGKQMSDKWIDDAIKEMRKQGLITNDDLYNDLLTALDEGRIRKVLVVVQNTPMNGKTVTQSLTEEGLEIRDVDLIKIGEVI